MPLTEEEVERYARHIVLPEVGGPGQNRLKASSVLVIGAGGLGSPLLLYLRLLLFLTAALASRTQR